MPSIQPQQSTTSMASFGVIDFNPESDLVDLDPEFVFLVVVLAEPLVEALRVLEEADLVGIDPDRRHQQTR